MPVKIIIEDPEKWRRMNRTFPDDSWQNIISDPGSGVTISEAGTRVLEDGSPRYLENSNPRNLE